MKKQLALLTLVLAVLSFNFVMIMPNPLAAAFSWSSTEIDLGQIELNRPVTAEFRFENSGDAPLVIVSAKGSCGCTVAEYTKGEILPGEYGEVTATYDAAKPGAFNKTVTVNANTPGGPMVLRLSGEVVE